MARVAVALLVGVAACHHSAPTYPALDGACDRNRIGTVSVEGAPASEVAGIMVLEGTRDDPARTERVARQTIETMRSDGYARASLTITPKRGCRVDLRVDVSLGPKFKISDIAFATDDAFPAAVRTQTIEDALGGINSVGGVYSPARLKRSLSELNQRYYDAGWLEVQIGEPIAHYDDEHATIAVEIPVQAGRRFRIGQVHATGGEPAQRAVVMASLGLKNGDWYDGEMLRTGIERIRRKLGVLGQDVELRTNVSLKRREIDLEAVVEAVP